MILTAAPLVQLLEKHKVKTAVVVKILFYTSKRYKENEAHVSFSKIMENYVRLYNSSYWLPVTGNVYRANCTLCKREFGIEHGGEGDIKTHMSSESHKQAERIAKQSNTLTKFMISSKNTGLKDEVIAAEISMVYHSVNHSHSYRSLDCTLKLLPVVLTILAKFQNFVWSNKS